MGNGMRLRFRRASREGRVKDATRVGLAWETKESVKCRVVGKTWRAETHKRYRNEANDGRAVNAGSEDAKNYPLA